MRTPMFFRLTDEQQEIRDLVRKFAQNEIAPQAERWDEEGTFPDGLLRQMGELGLAGMFVPEELGGSALSRLSAAVLLEEVGKADMATAVWLSVHNMVTGLVNKFGDEEQRRRWVPRLASGDFWARSV